MSRILESQIERENAAFMREKLDAVKTAETSGKFITKTTSKSQADREYKTLRDTTIRELGYSTSNNIDPWDNTPSSRRAKNETITSLTQGAYGNKLLEKILKNSNRTDFDTASLKFQEQVLNYMKSISADIKTIVANTTPKVEEKKEETTEELAMKPTDLAKYIAALDAQGVFKELKTGIYRKMDSSGMGEMMKSFFDNFKSMVEGKEFGTTIKNMMQEAFLSRLPAKYRNPIQQWRDDPVKLIQMGINRLSGDRNSAIREIAQMFYSGEKPNENLTRKKVDLKAKAEFDNKFYLSVTKVIPDQLYRIVAALEGKPVKEFDWETQNGYVNSTFLAARYLEKLQGSRTSGVNKMMTTYGSLLETAIEKNSDFKKFADHDTNGVMVRDASGKPKLRHADTIRKVLENMISSNFRFEVFSPHMNVVSVVRQFRLDKGFKDDERWMVYEAVSLMNRTYLYGTDEARTDIITALEDTKKSVNNQTYNGELDNLDANEVESVARLLHVNSMNKDEWLNTLQNASRRYTHTDIGAGASGGSDKKGKRRGINYRHGRIVSDKDLNGQRDARDRIISGEYNSIEEIYHKYRDDQLTGEGYIKDSEGKFRSSLDGLLRNGLINRTEYEAYVRAGTEDGLRPKELEKYKKTKERLRRAIEIYQTMDQLGLTAQAKALTTGDSPEMYRSLGYLYSYEDVFKLLDDNNKLDPKKLAKFNMSNMTEAYMDTAQRELRKENRSTFDEGGVKGLSNTLSKIFGDPRIAGKAGFAAGGAAGLAIGKLLRDKGIVNSPRFGYILGAVGAGLMSMERTKNYFSNIFGPDGDIRGGKDGKGYTNKEIFMARFMTQYLPFLGIGGKAASGVLKAFTKLGPLGWAVGLPAAAITGIMAGSAGVAATKMLRQSLFKKRDKDDKSIMGKIGNFLKDFDFVKKYFALGDDADPITMRIQVLTRFRDREKARLSTAESTGDAVASGLAQANLNKIEKALKDLENLKSQLKDDGSNENELIEKADKIIQKLGDDAVIDKKDYDALYEAREEEKERRNEVGDAAGSEITTREEKRRELYGTARQRMVQDAKVQGGSGYDFENAEWLSKAQAGEYGLEAQSMAYVYENLGDSEEGSLENLIGDKISDYLTANRDHYDVLNEVLNENYDDIETILAKKNEATNKSYMDELNELIDARNNGTISEEEFGNKYKQWVNSLPKEAKENLIDVIRAKTYASKLMQEINSIAFNYLRYTEPGMNTVELQKETDRVIGNMIGNRKLSERISLQGAKLKHGFMMDVRQFLDGNDEDQSEYHQHLRMLNKIAGFEARYNGLDISELEGEGSGSSRKGRPTNDRRFLSQKEIRNKYFKNKKSLSEHGCAVAAAINLIKAFGYKAPTVDAVTVIANNHLGTDGVKTSFFSDLFTTLGHYAVVAYGKLTEKQVEEIFEDKSTKAIFLLKNSETNSKHFVVGDSIKNGLIRIIDSESNTPYELAPADISIMSETAILVIDIKEAKKLMAKAEINKAKAEVLNNTESKAEVLETPKVSGSEGMSADTNAEMNNLARNVGSVGGIAGLVNFLKKTFSKPLNVNINEDATLPLKVDDKQVAEELAKKQHNSAEGAFKEATGKVKNAVQGKTVQNALSESEQVQDKILEGGATAGAAGAAGVAAGKKGTWLDRLMYGDQAGEKGVQENSLLDHLNFLLHGPGKLLKLGLLGAVGYGGYKAAQGVGKGAKLWFDGLKNTFGIGHTDRDHVIDPETGEIIEHGDYVDSAAGLRQMRDGLALARGAAGATGYAAKGVMNVGKFLKNAKYVKDLKPVADIAKTMAGEATKDSGMTSRITSALLKGMSKLTKALQGSTLVGKLVGSSKKVLLGVIGSLQTKIEQQMPKLASKLASVAGKNAAKTGFKALPIIGTAVLIGMAGFSAWNGYKNAAKLLGVASNDDLDMWDKLKVAFAKVLYDVAPDLLASLLPPPLNLMATVVIAIIRQFFKLEVVLSWFFSPGELTAMRKRTKDGKTEMQKYKELEKELKQDEIIVEHNKKLVDYYTQQGKKDSDVISKQTGETFGEFKERILKEEKQLTEGDKAKELERIRQTMILDSRAVVGNIDSKNVDFSQLSLDGNPLPDDIQRDHFNAWSKGKAAGYVIPTKSDYTITSAYGNRLNPRTGTYKPHNGIDFRAGAGTPIKAVAAGVIDSVVDNGDFSYITVRHADGTRSQYMHVDVRGIKKGKKVAAGEVITKTKYLSPGSKMSPHLHLGMIGLDGKYQDPFIKLGLDPTRFKLNNGDDTKENRDYLAREAWLTKLSQMKVENINNAPVTPPNAPQEKGGMDSYDYTSYKEMPSTPLSDNQVFNSFNKSITENKASSDNLAAELKLLNTKFDMLLSYMTNLIGIIKENNNNFLLEVSTTGNVV